MLQLLERVMERRLSSTLAAVYGAHLTCRLGMAQARLLVKIADCILLLPNYSNLPTVLVTD